MPVSAAARDGFYNIAVITGIQDGSKRAVSALTYIADNLFMDPWHPVSIKFQILFPKHAEDLLNGVHDSTPCIT